MVLFLRLPLLTCMNNPLFLLWLRQDVGGLDTNMPKRTLWWSEMLWFRMVKWRFGVEDSRLEVYCLGADGLIGFDSSGSSELAGKKVDNMRASRDIGWLVDFNLDRGLNSFGLEPISFQVHSGCFIPCISESCIGVPCCFLCSGELLFISFGDPFEPCGLFRGLTCFLGGGDAVAVLNDDLGPFHVVGYLHSQPNRIVREVLQGLPKGGLGLVLGPFDKRVKLAERVCIDVDDSNDALDHLLLATYQGTALLVGGGDSEVAVAPHLHLVVLVNAYHALVNLKVAEYPEQRCEA